MKKTGRLAPDEFDTLTDVYGAGLMFPPAGANEGAQGMGYDDGEQFPDAAGAVDSGTTAAAKPVGLIADLATYLISGYWQYSGAIAHHWASNTITVNITSLNSAEQALARSALQAWREVANVSFVEVSSGANITFSNAGTMKASTSASWYVPSGQMASATVTISTDWITTDGGANDGKTGIDSYGYQTYLHEIGHALGLGHQGPYNNSGNYASQAIWANDTWQYSIMSYFSQANYAGTSRYVITPQMADIYAMAQIYGAATTTRTGDTVYGFNNTASSVYSFAAYTQAPALTIYDSGGNDTLDCSGYSFNQTIDLHAGSFSSVGGLVNNVGIALSTSIEKAIGGGGNDTLYANDLGCSLSGGLGNDSLVGAAGGDRLIGGAGVDSMWGAGGTDTFVFLVGDSSGAAGLHDRINDFAAGDKIDLSAIDAISGTAGLDLFRFLGTAAFDGVAGALSYAYNSATNITTLSGDTDGDRVANFSIDLAGNVLLGAGDVIGTQPVTATIESFGVTKLFQTGGNYYLNPVAGGTGPTLKRGGTPVVSGQFSPFVPIAAEKTATGYDVAWKVPGSDQYIVWQVDNNGNFITNLTDVVGASNATLQSLESVFLQDLNSDGVIGVPNGVVEGAGVTFLTQTNNNYYLNTSSATGPVLSRGGVAVTVGQFSPFVPIAAEKTATGYDVAWKVPGADQYIVWQVDNSGNFVANLTNVVGGNDPGLKSLESVFQQDLNGDGVISASSTVIESAGVTVLAQANNSYYLNTSGGAGPVLMRSGAAVTVGQFSPFVPIAAEKTATGYDVAWKVPGSDQYIVWQVDNSGNFVANLTNVVGGNDAGLKSLEPVFQQDLNDDGVIGIPTTVIESAGVTFLTQTNNNYYLNTSSATGPVLMRSGAAVTVGQFSPFVPIGAEKTSSGYDVAWKVPGADQYIVWQVDNSGNFVSNLTNVVSGSSATLKSFEPIFRQDLNGDAVVGMTAAAEAFGTEGSNAFVFASDPGNGSNWGAESNSIAPWLDLLHAGTMEGLDALVQSVSPLACLFAHVGLPAGQIDGGSSGSTADPFDQGFMIR